MSCKQLSVDAFCTRTATRNCENFVALKKQVRTIVLGVFFACWSPLATFSVAQSVHGETFSDPLTQLKLLQQSGGEAKKLEDIKLRAVLLWRFFERYYRYGGSANCIACGYESFVWKCFEGEIDYTAIKVRELPEGLASTFRFQVDRYPAKNPAFGLAVQVSEAACQYLESPETITVFMRSDWVSNQMPGSVGVPYSVPDLLITYDRDVVVEGIVGDEPRVYRFSICRSEESEALPFLLPCSEPQGDLLPMQWNYYLVAILLNKF